MEKLSLSIRSLTLLFAIMMCKPGFPQQDTSPTGSANREDTTMLQDVRLDIIYDNYPHPEGEVALWGFSCLIRNVPKTILFDAGGDGDNLMANLTELGIDPKIIEQMVISHDHGDHTAGLDRLLPDCQSPEVFLLGSFSSELKQKVTDLGGVVVENSNSVEICPHVFTTGEIIGVANEQALVLQTRGGLIVITGCAHPGLVKIVKRAKEMLKGDILLVMGGFHLLRHSEDAVNQVISELKDLSVRYVAPTHCTGDAARQMFRDAFGGHFIGLEVGSTIILSDLLDRP